MQSIRPKNCSFPEGVRLYRFNTQLPKTDDILKIAKLMSYMNFPIMIQAVLDDQKKEKLRRFERRVSLLFIQ